VGLEDKTLKKMQSSTRMEEATLHFDLVHVFFFVDSREVGCPIISHMLQH
jgi:hypothetical protein